MVTSLFTAALHHFSCLDASETFAARHRRSRYGSERRLQAGQYVMSSPTRAMLYMMWALQWLQRKAHISGILAQSTCLTG